MKQLKIGSIKLKNPLILAPMVDVTDLPYRLICRKAGASLACTEMLNIKSIIHPNLKTQMLMKTNEKDKPLGIQLTGSRTSDLRKVIPLIREYRYDLVDINCGCPSIRTTDNASGSYLLKTPKKIASYIKILKNAGFTATAKLRLGFKKNNILNIAKTIEKAGADALTIHSRLSWESYKTPADWSWIYKVKKQAGIPIIGNGDITTGEHAKKMLEIADGAMIARAAMGDPLIFSRILYYLRTGKEKKFNFSKNIKLFREYLFLAEKHKTVSIAKIKFIGANFIRNIAGAAKLRANLMNLKSFDEIKSFFDRITYKHSS